ncbi:MAG: hypothetical protein OER88_06475, partial [Planctomycetota bacterium]|nr:hypothetical protein [Planctomycetota bacterium]
PPAETVEPVLIELREDGSFGVVGEDETTFKDAAAVIEAYGATKPKPIIFLSNATKNVDRETLAKAADAMGGKLDVRLDFREGDG